MTPSGSAHRPCAAARTARTPRPAWLGWLARAWWFVWMNWPARMARPSWVTRPVWMRRPTRTPRPAWAARVVDERGAASVIIVGTFSVLLLFLGTSVDFGILLRYRRAMQNACDAGVLAGAMNLRNSPQTAGPTAEKYATGDMQQNNVSWGQIATTTLDQTGQVNNVSPDRVRMEIHADVPTYLFRSLQETVHVTVECMARLTPIIQTDGLAPLGHNYEQWIQYYSSPCWQYVKDGIPPNQRPAQCQSYDLTVNVNDPDNPWGPGNTGLLSMGCYDCSGGGASQWQEFFVNGAPLAFCYDLNHSSAVKDFTYNGAPCADVKTEPGTKVGAIRQGIAARCSYPPGSPERIIMIPLLNPAFVDGGQGTYTTEIWGFAAFEIDCATTNFTGADPTIRGAFVSIVNMRTVGIETEFDTGMYTIKMIQ